MSFGSQMGTEANIASGTFLGVNGMQMLLGSVTGAPGILNVDDQSIFTGKTLVDLGVLAPGEVVVSPGLVKGTWTLQKSPTDPVQTITPRATPGPLPLLGVSMAFGWSRTLRRRIQKAQAPLSS